MTNMDGVGLLFLMVMGGVPILLLVIIAAYIAHRRGASDREQMSSDTRIQKTESLITTKDLIRSLVLQPDNFFTQVTEEKTNLFRPFILQTVCGMIFYIGYLSALDPVFLQSIQNGAIGNLLIIGLGTSAFFIIPGYIAWILLSAGFFAGSAAFKGTGTFLKTLQNAGYGAAIFLLVSGVFLLLSTLGYLVLITNHSIDFPAPPVSLPLAVQAAALILPLIWAVILWSKGLEHARKIPFMSAAISVSAVTLAGIGLLCGRTILAYAGIL